MKKIDFILLFDATDANPNGDPDGGNMPRIDPETGHGIVTDVCLKRKIRNYVQLVKQEEIGYDIYVKEKAVLNLQHDKAYKALSSQGKTPTVDEARSWMCQNFYDIRAFGAVMTTGVNCGQVRGPIQLSFSRSIDPITQLEHTITRCAVTEVKKAEKERTMGRKYTVPYGLYMAKGTINPFLASCKDKEGNEKGTGFDENDLELFKEALVHMFEFDASAARPAGSMVMRKVILFHHDSELGSAPAHKLYELLKVAKKPGVEVPRSYADYDVQLAKEQLPSGVTVEEL